MTLLTLLKGPATSNVVPLVGASNGEAGGILELQLFRTALGGQIFGTTYGVASAVIVFQAAAPLGSPTSGHMVRMTTLDAAAGGARVAQPATLNPPGGGAAARSAAGLAPVVTGLIGRQTLLNAPRGGVALMEQSTPQAPSAGITGPGARPAAPAAGIRGT